MNVYRKLLTFLILITFSSCFYLLKAQEPVTVKKSENKVIIEGKVYFIHIVKPGQTLYAISKAYNVTEKDIAIENPGVYSGLQVGQMLKIPEQVPSREGMNIEKADTARFIYHTLQLGENLFALSRSFNVTVDEIRQANPALDENHLRIGQVILIPRAKSVYKDEDFIFHKVRRRDTLFGISKRYNVSIDDIRKFNPELQWGGLKTGQIVRIPKAKAIQEYAVITGDTITVPDSLNIIIADTVPPISFEEYASELPYYKGKKLNVAFLIPYAYQEKVEQLKENEEEAELKSQDQTESPSDQLPAAVNFIEFMQGSLLAVDSLRKEGLSLNIHYFDTHESPEHMRKILASPFFRNVDLIVGPFYSWNVEIVNDFSREHRIPMVCPFYSSDSLTATNPYFFQLNPSYTTEIKQAAQYLAKDFDKNFVFIYGTDSLETKKIEYFKSELLKSLENYTYSENAIVKEIIFDNIAHADISNDLTQAFSKDKENVVIILVADDEAFVTALVSQLYFQLRNFDIRVFGMPQWPVFQHSDFIYFHKLGLTYITPYYYSFEDPAVKAFLEKFRKTFKAEPSYTTRKGCPYAFLGYDATFAFLDAIRKEDNQFIRMMINDDSPKLLPGFRFRKKTTDGGFENQSLRVVTFKDDFTISVSDILSEQPNQPESRPFFRGTGDRPDPVPVNQQNKHQH